MGNDGIESIAIAIGSGLLIGIERERRNAQPDHHGLAGIRTFAIVALMGNVAAQLKPEWLVVLGALLVAALGVVAYAKDTSKDPGVTTEVTLLLTFLLGVLSLTQGLLAAALSVVVTGLLTSRDKLHRFARHWLSQGEIHDGLTWAALVLIALPLMPDKALWQGMLNPRQILQLLTLLLLIQALAHLAKRLMEEKGALMLSSVASGFVSSTATIAQLGLTVKRGQASASQMAGAALLTCVATLMNILAVAAVTQPTWLSQLWIPCVAGVAVVGVWGWWLAVGQYRAAPPALSTLQFDAPDKKAAEPSPRGQPMFRMREALIIVGLLTGMQVGVKLMAMWLGDGGMLIAAVIASLADLHSAIVAVLVQGAPGSVHANVIRLSIMAGLLTHAVSRTTVAWFTGGRDYALALAPGMAVHTLLVVVLFWFFPIG